MVRVTLFVCLLAGARAQTAFGTMPPEMPSPPTSPPWPPGMACSDSCGYAMDGACDDGGTNSEYSACAMGTDCTDCGARPFCTSCSAECQLRNLQATGPCFEEHFLSPNCDDSCNNIDCGYEWPHCTADQIISKCKIDQYLGNINYLTAPTTGGAFLFHEVDGMSERVWLTEESALSIDNLQQESWVPVALHLNLEPARLLVDSELNEMVMQADLQYVLQWRDERLHSTPCAGVLTGMISLEPEQALSDIARDAVRVERNAYWMPRIQLTPPRPTYRPFDESTRFELALVTQWLAGHVDPASGGASGGASGDGSDSTGSAASHNVTNVAQFTGDIELQLSQSHFDYYYFPFDRQVIKA